MQSLCDKQHRLCATTVHDNLVMWRPGQLFLSGCVKGARGTGKNKGGDTPSVLTGGRGVLLSSLDRGERHWQARFTYVASRAGSRDRGWDTMSQRSSDRICGV